jgi:uroporphyrinogen decarboxylase
VITSKDLVRKAIAFRSPERVPYNFDSNRTPVIAERYGDDFEWVFSSAAGDTFPRPLGNDRYVNEFGVVYHRPGVTFGEAREFPLADLARVQSYQVPDFSRPARFAAMEEIVRHNPDKYILGMFPHFLFQQMMDLFGFEQLMVAFLGERWSVDMIADRLMQSCLRMVDCFADRGADGMIAIEDLGLQDRLIIAPDLWREVFKPRMAAVVEACHARKMHFFIHCCGGIVEVIEDFIEIGVDVLQIDQQDNMGIDELARRFAGRLCFFCPVDIQTTLPLGPVERIQSQAKHLMKAFGSRGGGFMAKTYPQPGAIGIPEEYTRVMCETFRTFGRYPFQF